MPGTVELPLLPKEATTLGPVHDLLGGVAGGGVILDQDS